MTYQGQLIHEFPLDLDFGSFENYQQQITTFARFLQVMFTILALFVSIKGISTFTMADFALWLIFSIIVLLALQRVINRLQNTDISTDTLPPLQIYEYGIQLPAVLSEEETETDVYLTFNQMDKIEVHDDVIYIRGNQSFVISTYLIADEMIDLFMGMFEKISTKVSEVENRDYPTIIPRAYFKDLFP